MRYQICHRTHYGYQESVTLQTHTLRLRPRSDAGQQVINFDLKVDPVPQRQIELVEIDGNQTLRLWFDQVATRHLTIEAVSEVITYRSNPFDYLAEPWAVHLPIDYPLALAASLQPYLQASHKMAVSPQIIDLAEEILHGVEGNVGFFLTTLNQRIYQSCQYGTRTTGQPWPPGITWAKKSGSCRDFAVLFIAVCRAVGLAARFVSGYEEGDSRIAERDLHAWAEVYIPGGGWRGFDPTHGLAVSNRHIALVASPFPKDTAPVQGSTVEGSQVKSSLATEVRVRVI
ncbi:MAG: transglutaminase family protein [Cyanobacteria bacterium REEB459]|nr:transglutaminase family protein [Cyanobacteria bacterium REEB459]